MTATEKDTYLKAINKCGAVHQVWKLFEEMAELQDAVCKFADKRDSTNHIAEEIADVRIMLDQLCVIHGCGVLAEEWKKRKLKELEERLEKDDV